MSDYVGNRLSSRYPSKLKIKLKGRNFKEAEFFTSNLSVGGVFIKSDSPPTLGLPVEIKLFLPSSKRPLKIRGKILRIKWTGHFENIEGFGVEFKKMDREAEDKLLNFLNKLEKERL